MPYGNFTKLLQEIAKGRTGSPFWEKMSVLTFNYDLAMDYALYCAGIPFNYGLEDGSHGALDLLKLHGSLNWRLCGCKAVVPWSLSEYLQKYQWRDIFDVVNVRLGIASRTPERSHCAETLAPEPFIVPPTGSKGAHHTQLAPVWRKAAQHFSEATHIFIIGYSYPTTDEFFKYLYALGSVGDAWLERIVVFNPDEGVSHRINDLLGQQAKSKFAYAPKENRHFASAIDYMRNLRLS